MFNVTVLKMKDLIKYFVVVVIITITIFATKYFLSYKNENKIESISSDKLIKALKFTLPKISGEDEEENKNYLEEFLNTEIASMKMIENNKNKDGTKIELQNDEKENIELNPIENKETQIVTTSPIAENFNVLYNNIKIKNQTSYTLTEEMMNPDITIDNKNILIFHTHSCESYTPTEKYLYNPTGNFRSIDLNYTVTRVGTELEKYLKEYNFNVFHDTSYHDYPAYNGSYTRSLTTVEGILQNNPSDIIIDLHRDAIGSNAEYAPKVKIGEDYCAQIMFVIRYK